MPKLWFSPLRRRSDGDAGGEDVEGFAPDLVLQPARPVRRPRRTVDEHSGKLGGADYPPASPDLELHLEDYRQARLNRTGIENEIAQRVGHQLVAVTLEILHPVWVVSEDHIRAGVDQRVRRRARGHVWV